MNEWRYSEQFEKYASALEAYLEQKLARKLSSAEKNGLRNAGTFLMLESVDQSIYYAKSKEDIEKVLIDCTEGFQSRYNMSADELMNKIEKELGREVRAEEKEKLLSSLRNVNEITAVIEKLKGNKKIESVEELL